MTFRQLALSNVRGRALRYAAFFLSSVFSVTLFFLYAQFIFHPDVTNGYIYGGEGARIGMIVCEVLIVVFSFFFVLYSSTSFLRARHQEFGLLTLLGTTRSQLRRLIWLENTFLSIAAIGTGLACGLLFSKLFLMALSRLLLIEEPIRFLVVPQAVLLTAIGFFLLFQVITVVSVARIGGRSVIDLLGEARKPKPQPKASPLLALLALLLIAAGYVGAMLVETMWIVLAFFPIVGVVTLGTYLLFTQASVYLIGALKARPRLYLEGPRLLIISQLVFRMKDNARLLATVATMSAVVLSAAGTFYVMSRQLVATSEAAHPEAVAFVERGTPGVQAIDPAEVEGILGAQGIEPTVKVDVRGVELPYLVGGESDEVRYATLLSESSYRRMVEETRAPVGQVAGEYGTLDNSSLAAGERWYIDPWFTNPYSVTEGMQAEELGIPVIRPLGENGSELEGIEIVAAVDQRPVTPVHNSGPWLVASDVDFEERYAQAPAESRLRIQAYDWRNWTRTKQVNDQIAALVTDEVRPYVSEKWTDYQKVRQVLGLSFFIGLFISLLFFIGAGSMIYFKLFTELPEDRKLFASLRRIGITGREMRHVISTQVALVFLLPFLVGAVHALFALNTLGNLLVADVLGYSLIVVAMFAAVQAIFFGLTRWTYLRTLLPAR